MTTNKTVQLLSTEQRAIIDPVVRRLTAAQVEVSRSNESFQGMMKLVFPEWSERFNYNANTGEISECPASP